MAALRYAAASLGSSHGRRFHRQFMRTRRLIRRERDQRLRAEPTRASSPDAAQTDPSSDRSPQSCHRPYMPGPFNKPRAKHACAPPPSRGTASGTPYVVIFPRAHPAQHNQEHRIRQGRCLGWRLGIAVGSAIGQALRYPKISTQRGESGTRCSWPIFIRLPGNRPGIGLALPTPTPSCAARSRSPRAFLRKAVRLKVRPRNILINKL